jgi:hypothetical protein
MQKFTVLRNDAYWHVDAGVIPNELYDVYKQDIEENIMVLARKLWKWRRDAAGIGWCTDTLCTRYKNRLSEQIQRDQEMMEVCRVIF